MPEELRVIAEPGEGDAADPLSRLIDELSGGDPRLQMIATLMRRAQAAPPGPAAQEPRAEWRRLKARYLGLREAYQALLQRNEVLAAALGACGLCWGEDATCGSCGGHGGPGAYPPDRALCCHYALPAVRSLRGAPPSAWAPEPAPATNRTIPSPMTQNHPKEA